MSKAYDGHWRHKTAPNNKEELFLAFAQHPEKDCRLHNCEISSGILYSNDTAIGRYNPSGTPKFTVRRLPSGGRASAIDTLYKHIQLLGTTLRDCNKVFIFVAEIYNPVEPSQQQQAQQQQQ